MCKTVLFFMFICCLLQKVLTDKVQEVCKHNNCRDCIRDSNLCAWCSEENLKLEDRCQPANSKEAKTCSADYSDDPRSNVGVAHDNDLNFNAAKDHPIQIKPQKIAIKLRVGEEIKFQFHYKAIENYPVDLYFLLDASHSMKEVRNEIFNKSKEIYDSMYNLTNNIYLGYGTFIDKKILPFNNNYENKCFSFKHDLNLTPELKLFQKHVEATEFGQNFDLPEGGFDALAQIMACKDRIEFRNQSRKVVIFLTDQHSHHAGDGHAAGIINPYDGGCYLDADGYYTKETEMDYPSVSRINKLAADDQFTIFFVVTQYHNYYTVLASAISGAQAWKYIGDDISEKLKDFYAQISNNIHLDVNVASEDKDHFEITFDPDCSVKNNCAVVIGKEIQINGLIKLKEYYGKNNIVIPIMQKGIKEKLLLDINIISKCDNCEREESSSYEANSGYCNSGGDLQCGVCKCYKNRNGPTCACGGNNRINSTDTTLCVKDGIECSGNGKCVCGSCSCRPGFDGQYCDVRTDGCERDRYTLTFCSGHGKCWNGTCLCNDLWQGKNCECSKSNDLCKSVDGSICNNRGRCECERCNCGPLPKWDIRNPQDDHCSQWPCEDCHTRQCRALIDCISCYNSKNSTEDCRKECGDKLTIETYTVAEELKSNLNVCVNARVTYGCYANFSYAYHDETQEIVVYWHWQSEMNCIESYIKYGAISLLSALIVGLVIMWGLKVLTDAHDRAEYERFLSTPDDDDVVENPTYKQPTRTFRNPNFKNSFKFR